MNSGWVRGFPGAVTVCDAQGIIVELNAAAARMYRKWGGSKLIGRNVLDCHPEPARTRMAELLAAPRLNVYTIERRGVKKWVYQAPWYAEGQYAGLVELVLTLPAEVPHFVREP